MQHSQQAWLRGAFSMALAACAVLSGPLARAQAGEWIWWSGSSNTQDFNGSYGTLGVASASNVPGAREKPVSWTDLSGNLWLFGGSAAADAQVGSIHFNDLWKFDTTLQEWIWMGGSNTGAFGVYGTMGVAAAGNVPGSRTSSVGWVDKTGNLWLFGGWGYDSAGTFGVLNDLWEYNTSSGNWVWVGGNKTLPNTSDSCWPGVYGTQSVAAAGNLPGGRQLAVGWTDNEGKFWLSGGGGCDANDIQVLLNDLWKFDPDTQQWAWISGSSTDYRVGQYGTEGVPAAGNVPGSRWEATAWSDTKGNLWLFGGNGIDAASARGYLNDLWKFNIATSQWTWVSGSSAIGSQNCFEPDQECAQPGVYGTLGKPAPGNVPEGRNGSVGSIDDTGHLWLFGGDNNPGPIINLLNDLWEFDPETQEWAWMGGSDTIACGVTESSGTCIIDGNDGVYGMLGVPSPSNVPGSRSDTVSWTGKDGTLWLFGGNGLDAESGTLNILNDLWEYQIKQTPAIAITASARTLFAGNPVTISAKVAASGEYPSGTVTFLDGGTSFGTATLDSSGKASFTEQNPASGTHSFTASYGGDSLNFSAVSPALTVTAEDFSITAGTATTASISPGGSATYTISIGPVAPATSLPSAVTLAAKGGPTGATYTFSPASVTAGSGTTAVTLTVTAPAASASAANSSLNPAGGLALAVLLAPLAVPWRKTRKRFRVLIPVLVLALGFVFAVSVTGCGSGGSGTQSSQPQNYTINIQGAGGNLVHSVNVQLTVN
jgi:N-acetylneuraminic acid mutarotase